MTQLSLILTKRFTLALSGLLLLLSCSSGPSLQRYFVDKTADANFLIINLPITLDAFPKTTLTAEEQRILGSVEKLNILMFYNDNVPQTSIANEIKMLNGILSNGTKYLKLSDFGYRKNKASLYYMGKERKVDEGILYLRNAEKGLVVVRILGDNMNPGALMMLANKINSSEVMDALGGQIKPLFESLSNQKKSEENKSI